ncbi:uncharacterized protein T551_03387 [Pneumocystis jirovecii RU7]|uniref:Uncharacterized protein n=1 Tax=Pneumocystis jirovecii (strain RU7) TaxID=1408657 RepID=A0A0W4ZEX4_PNEJ7|nr:uncharacterized protein T551_03387 [Pneumocystis jirovecii RU7]KTW26925.1 hypothetical protein T551_03387 [Pneumocystis jirovecii RU7]
MPRTPCIQHACSAHTARMQCMLRTDGVYSVHACSICVLMHRTRAVCTIILLCYAHCALCCTLCVTRCVYYTLSVLYTLYIHCIYTTIYYIPHTIHTHYNHTL